MQRDTLGPLASFCSSPTPWWSRATLALVSPLALTWEKCDILRRVLYADNVLMLKIRAHRYPLPPTPLTPTHTQFTERWWMRGLLCLLLFLAAWTLVHGAWSWGGLKSHVVTSFTESIRQFILWGLRRIMLLKCLITKTSHTWRKHAFP